MFLKFLKENFGNRPSANEGERAELAFLKKEIAALKKSVGDGATSAKGGDSSSDSEGDEDMVADLPVSSSVGKPAAGPRQSVSAEVFGRFNKEVAYTPPVHKKTDE